MNNKLNIKEKKLIAGMSILIFIRMLGASMIFPIFSIFAIGLVNSNETLAGIAFGIFGIAQVIFQIPMGKLSDHWGRKETVLLGFGIYFLGTLLSGLSTNIYYLIITRFIAGAGAVAGVMMAWITDGVDKERRNFAIAFVGISYGISAIVGLPAGGLIAGYFNPSMVFFVGAALTFLAIIFVVLFLKNNKMQQYEETEEHHFNKQTLFAILKNKDIIRLNICGFVANFNFIAIFFAIPLIITKTMHVKEMWKIMGPASIIGTFMMFIFARQADKRGTVKIGVIGFLIEFSSLFLFIIAKNIFTIYLSFILFYIGHCILSPILPVAVSKFSTKNLKGTVMSAFTSSQFLGVGLGGIISGYLYKNFTESYFIIISIISIFGLISMAGFKNFKKI